MTYTEVAVGVLIRTDGAVLFGQRPQGKPYAGWWEFPGGKLEVGETVEQALARELDEELGIAVQKSLPWAVLTYLYPHAHVRLHFQKVVAWQGEPASRENQSLRWIEPEAAPDALAKILPAAWPVLEWFNQPQKWFLNVLKPDLNQPDTALVLHQPGLADDAFELCFSTSLAAVGRHRLWVSEAHGDKYAHRCAGWVFFGEPDPRISGEFGVLSATPQDVARLSASGAQFVLLDSINPNDVDALSRVAQRPCYPLLHA
jgi:8-oxo-dGTP diphosphatase